MPSGRKESIFESIVFPSPSALFKYQSQFSFIISMQNDLLYWRAHQPAEQQVHQGGREKLCKNAADTESLSNVSLESWASWKTSRGRQKGLVGGQFPPINCHFLFCLHVSSMDKSACLLVHCLVCMCAKKKAQHCSRTLTQVKQPHLVTCYWGVLLTKE